MIGSFHLPPYIVYLPGLNSPAALEHSSVGESSWLITSVVEGSSPSVPISLMGTYKNPFSKRILHFPQEDIWQCWVSFCVQQKAGETNGKKYAELREFAAPYL